MCRIFAGQNPDGFRCVTRSVRLSGHATSIRLEAAFWDMLDRIARDQGLTTPKFLTMLHEEALQLRGEVQNFTSMLRTTCLLYASGSRPERRELATLADAAVSARA